jgi:hypothetical protein
MLRQTPLATSVLPSTNEMSEKLKEFVQIPQEFVVEGNKVGYIVVVNSAQQPAHTFAVPDTVHQTVTEGLAPHPAFSCHANRFVSRVCGYLQGSRHRFCCHGIHRLLRQAYPYSHVSTSTSQLVSALTRHRNNILVYASPPINNITIVDTPTQRWRITPTQHIITQKTMASGTSRQRVERHVCSETWSWTLG